MQNIPVSRWLVPLLMLSLTYTTYGQRTCKARRTGGSSSGQAASVFIQITDETHGKIVTYQKEYKLDHIPAIQREQYVDNLIDELTGLSDEQESFFIKKKGTLPARKQPAKRQRYAGNVR